jgi:hypothetical protein
MPFDLKNHSIYDPGIFYSCKLKKDTIYTFELKRITLDNIPKSSNSYYSINATFHQTDSTITEFRKNTPFHYQGTSGMYVDIKNKLFEIIRMTPLIGCVMQH